MAADSWIVLDRDGVINVDYVDYVKNLSEWQSIPGSIEAIAELCNAGYKIAIATNQSGIARGIYSVETLDEIHDHLDTLVEQRGGVISGIFYCPHKPEDHCACRKPKVGLLDEIEKQFSIDLKGMPFIGDSERDLQAAIAKGCKPVLVRSGKGNKTEKLLAANDNYKGIAVYDDLASYTRDLLDIHKI